MKNKFKIFLLLFLVISIILGIILSVKNLKNSQVSIDSIGGNDMKHYNTYQYGDIVYSIIDDENKYVEVSSYNGNGSSIIIPDNITIDNKSYTVTTIGDGAFRGCSSLESITIPDNVTTLGSCVLAECTKLNKVVIGNGVNRIEDESFSGCDSLELIIVSTNTTFALNSLPDNKNLVIGYRDLLNIVYQINSDDETVRVIENPNNKEVPEKIEINGKEYDILKEGPVITFKLSNNKEWTKDDVIVEITVTDSEDITSLKLNSTDIILVDGKAKISINKNDVYKITATNKSGKSNTRHFTISNIDKVAPIIERVSNEKVYSGTITPVIKDNESGVDTILLTKNGSKVGFLNGDLISKKGKYELKVTDVAGNSTTITFEITDKFDDVTWLEINGISKEYTAEDQNIQITITNNEDVNKVMINDIELEKKSSRYTYKAKKKGSYILKIYDTYDNLIYYDTLEVLIDKKAPIITGVKENETYTETVIPILEDDESGIGIIELTKDGTMIKNYTQGTEINESGEYRLIVYDKVGNFSSVNFSLEIEEDKSAKEKNGNDNITAKKETSQDTTKTDDTIANNSLPYAGKYLIGIFTIVLIGISIVLYVKNKQYRDVK